jgi:hypothetical protein
MGAFFNGTALVKALDEAPKTLPMPEFKIGAFGVWVRQFFHLRGSRFSCVNPAASIKFCCAYLK